MKDSSLASRARLVRMLALQMSAKMPPNVELDDLLQAARMGQWETDERFDPAFGVKPETYATHRINGAMIDELRRNDWLSKEKRQQKKRIDAAKNKLQHQLDHRPLQSEVAAEVGISLEEYYELLNHFNTTLLLHLEDMTGDNGDEDFLDRFVPTEAEDPLTILQAKRDCEMVVAAIGSLTEREQSVLRMIYEENMSPTQIAKVLKVDPGRVCQIHKASLARLRNKVQAATAPGLQPTDYSDIIKW